MGKYILIESGTARERAEKALADSDAAYKAYAEWAAKHGCTGWYGPGPGGRPIGLPSCPDGAAWKFEPRGKFWSPRRTSTTGKAILEEIAALPEDPLHVGLFGNALAAELVGWRKGNLRGAQFVRAGSSIAVYIFDTDIMGFDRPDDLARLAVFEPPEGCREISETEWKLIVARFKVEKAEAEVARGAA